MTSTKTMMVVFMAILFCLLFISESSFAQIYKWVDEKGTINFSDDPGTREFRGMVEPKEGLETAEKWGLGKRNLSKDDLAIYLKSIPDTPKRETNYSQGPSRSRHDSSNDRDYQEMLKKIGKSQYYQRDYYTPKSGVPRARRGEIDPGAEKAARELKGNIDQLVRDPRWETSSEYRDEVKKYFKGHFNEKDEYYSNTGTVKRGSGEIKVPRTEKKQTTPSGSREIDANTGAVLIKVKGGAVNSKTGRFYPGGAGGIIDPQTGQFMPDVGGGYVDPKTGGFVPKVGK